MVSTANALAHLRCIGVDVVDLSDGRIARDFSLARWSPEFWSSRSAKGAFDELLECCTRDPLLGAEPDEGQSSLTVRTIRERRGWTQQEVAERLALLTKHVLPQASISAMERGFDGDRRRRFDAHELYLLSMVFGVPIAYFFLPPPNPGAALLAD